MRHIITICFVFAIQLAYGQHYLKTAIDSTVVFCGESKSVLKISNKTIQLVTTKGSLNLTVTEKEDNSKYICKDEQGDVYYVGAMYLPEDEGSALIFFRPEKKYLVTYIIANRDICGTQD